MRNPDGQNESSDPSTPMSDPSVKAARAELKASCFDKTIDGFINELAARRSQTIRPIETPWECINRELGGGFWPGLYFLVGGTGSGKSQFAMQVAINAASRNIPVLYVALELAPLDLFARTVALMQRDGGSNDKWSEYWFGEKPIPDGPASPIETMRRLPFHWAVGKPQGWPASNLAIYTQALHDEYPDAEHVFVVVDFVQLLGADVPGQALRERIGSAAYAARAVARDYKASVLALSSVARDFYATLNGEEEKVGPKKALPMGQGDPGRFIGLGKESGEVEFSADYVLVLGREKWANGVKPKGGTHVHVAIAKTRAKPLGCTGWAELRFDGSAFTEPHEEKDIGPVNPL